VKIVVGKAKAEDIFKIADLLDAARGEVAHELPPIELPHSYHKLLDFAAGELVWVARVPEEDRIVGVIILEPHRLWYRSRAHFLESVEFYVLPEFRKGGTAARLVEKAKEAADSAAVGGVPLVMSLTSGRMAEVKDRFIESLGFDYMGGSLIYQMKLPKEEALPDLKEAV
jgi:GNAT superfamily N-acetyltransferase